MLFFHLHNTHFSQDGMNLQIGPQKVWEHDTCTLTVHG